MSNAPYGPSPTFIESIPERSLLDPARLAKWRGVKLGYFAAVDHEVARNIWLDHPCVGVLTQGAAGASIQSGARVSEIDIGPGVAGVFGPQFELYRSTWRCRNARRIFSELETETYAALGLDDELLPCPVQQDLAVPDPDLAALMLAMVEEIQAGCPHGTLYAQTLSQGFLRHIHRHHSAASRAGVLPTDARLRRVQLDRVLDHVRAHLSDDISLQDLAGQAGVSRAHFVRLFRQTLGVSPHQYIISQRIRHGRFLLSSSETGLAEVALICGFASQSHFCAMFKRAMGITPGRFRADFGRGVVNAKGRSMIQ